MISLSVEYLNRTFLEEIEAMVTEMATAMQEFLTDSLIDNRRLSYGDIPLSPAERIQKFLDDEMMGVNNVIRVENPDEYQRRLKDFRRDVESTGLVEDLLT